jgi:hypothetical protein
MYTQEKNSETPLNPHNECKKNHKLHINFQADQKGYHDLYLKFEKSLCVDLFLLSLQQSLMIRPQHHR